MTTETAQTQPAPGATDRVKEPIKKAPKPRPRKPLDEQGLKASEDKLREKYPHIRTSTLTNATKGLPTPGLTEDEVAKFNHKRSIIIVCIGEDCTAERRIATSDLAQVQHCEDCTRINRNSRKRDRRAAKRAK